MGNITLGQIIEFILSIGSLIGAVSVILVAIQKIIKNQFKPINETIKKLDVSQCKNFLVRFLADVEQGENLDSAEIERAYEIYDHYKKDLNQNSYIHHRWVELMENQKKKEGKI